MYHTLALIFDFDDTLVPDSTTTLLKQYGVNTEEFWKKDVKELVTSGYDTTLAYLQLMLEKVGDQKPLGKLTNKDLRKFGATLDSEFYVGIPGLFKDLKALVRNFKTIQIEFYVISGGLREVIEGSKTIKKYFSAIYGCELAEDADTGILRRIKRCVTFTEKTRYLFEINKGLLPAETGKNPYLVNKDVPKDKRQIPFENMIYVGDGLTDIPCFSLMKNMGGTAFGVFNPGVESSAKRGFLEFLKTGRVVSIHAPKYRKNDELGSLIRAAVSTRCSKLRMLEHEAGS